MSSKSTNQETQKQPPPSTSSRAKSDDVEESLAHPAQAIQQLQGTPPPNLSASSLLSLQRTVGNQAVQRMLVANSTPLSGSPTGTIQRRLMVDRQRVKKSDVAWQQIQNSNYQPQGGWTNAHKERLKLWVNRQAQYSPLKWYMTAQSWTFRDWGEAAEALDARVRSEPNKQREKQLAGEVQGSPKIQQDLGAALTTLAGWIDQRYPGAIVVAEHDNPKKTKNYDSVWQYLEKFKGHYSHWYPNGKIQTRMRTPKADDPITNFVIVREVYYALYQVKSATFPQPQQPQGGRQGRQPGDVADLVQDMGEKANALVEFAQGMVDIFQMLHQKVQPITGYAPQLTVWFDHFSDLLNKDYKRKHKRKGTQRRIRKEIQQVEEWLKQIREAGALWGWNTALPDLLHDYQQGLIEAQKALRLRLTQVGLQSRTFVSPTQQLLRMATELEQIIIPQINTMNSFSRWVIESEEQMERVKGAQDDDSTRDSALFQIYRNASRIEAATPALNQAYQQAQQKEQQIAQQSIRFFGPYHRQLEKVRALAQRLPEIAPMGARFGTGPGGRLVRVDKEAKIDGEEMETRGNMGDFTPEARHPWVQEARVLNMPLGAGASNTTDRLLYMADLAGVPAEGKEAISWAGFAFWNQSYLKNKAPKHTFHEVMDVASLHHGVNYTAGQYPQHAPSQVAPQVAQQVAPQSLDQSMDDNEESSSLERRGSVIIHGEDNEESSSSSLRGSVIIHGENDGGSEEDMPPVKSGKEEGGYDTSTMVIKE